MYYETKYQLSMINLIIRMNGMFQKRFKNKYAKFLLFKIIANIR